MALGPRVERFGPFRRDRDRVDRLLYAEIAARRESDVSEREDILSLLLAARHEDGSPMTDHELRDQLLTLLVAGHETTANALAWAGERLARHPDAYRRLADEAAAGSGTYLTAVVQETLRLRPVISVVGRVLKAPMRVAGYDLPAGTTVAPCIYLLHRRPDIYPIPSASPPSASWSARRAPTPGSRSEAGSAAAWARPSRSSRWRRCCASSSPAPSSARPGTRASRCCAER